MNSFCLALGLQRQQFEKALIQDEVFFKIAVNSV